MCHNRYIEYTLMYIGYKCIGYECVCYVEYNKYSFMYFITSIIFFKTRFYIFIKYKILEWKKKSNINLYIFPKN